MQTTVRLSQSSAGSRWVIGAIDDDPIFKSRHFSDAFEGRALLAELREAIFAGRWAVIELGSGAGLRSIFMAISKRGSFLGTTVVVRNEHNAESNIPEMAVVMK